jgi:hypothetical protein
MRTILCALPRMVLVAGICLVCALAQQAPSERHVRDVRAEQPFEVISASPLCQKVRAADSSLIDRREIDPTTLETDLSTLMQKSDEVVLAARRDQIRAIAPSGDQAVAYFDEQVLRSWKGTHKPGDLLTFAMPYAAISCGSEPGNDRPSMAVFTATAGSEWDGMSAGPVVLFLRQSSGDETRFTPGLRLTAGDGMQGLFVLHHDDPRSDFDRDCRGGFPSSLAKCNERLDASQETVKVQYRRDPLKKKYEALLVPDFLKEVESLAQFSDRSGPAATAKPR